MKGAMKKEQAKMKSGYSRDTVGKNIKAAEKKGFDLKEARRMALDKKDSAMRKELKSLENKVSGKHPDEKQDKKLIKKEIASYAKKDKKEDAKMIKSAMNKKVKK